MSLSHLPITRPERHKFYLFFTWHDRFPLPYSRQLSAVSDGVGIVRIYPLRKKSPATPTFFCKQVRLALGEALICDCADPAFEDLQVIEVRMASGTTALEVIVCAPQQDDALLEETTQGLRRAEGLLRASISSAIHRKRLPRLKFCLVPIPQPEWHGGKHFPVRV